ncbi:MAG: aldehyde dehydrogenase family protein [Verrucomicrobiota bacterium]|jgi:acyl-CoA reductase-like NAD-dependent aldehyde dehydrogenase/nicotinamidase-related amidase
MKPALLLVDLQGDHLATPELRPSADAVVTRAAVLLENCRHRRIPVIHIWTTIRRNKDRRLPHWERTDRWMCIAGTSGHQPPALLQPQASETIIHKRGFNAFAGADLDSTLQRLNCDTAIVAGVHLHTCVRLVAMGCLERHLQVFMAEDAVASEDPIYSASTRRWLAERCVEFEPVSAILARLDGGAPPALIHRSPRATDEVLFEVPIAGASEVASAAAAAQDAWANWRRTPPSARQQLLENLANRLDAAGPDLAQQMAIEIGKPISQGFEEVHRAAQNVRDVIRRAAEFEPLKREPAGLVRLQPLGVVAVISPWNNPVAIPVGKIAPALAYGNTVVWKPAPAALRIAQVILRLLHEAGVPADAVRLLTGDHNTAQQLAANENVNAVTFTGSVLAGYSIQEICARRIVPLQAELSGNNAAIVWDDADLSHAARQVAWGAFAFAGQRCTANRRTIVSAPRFENFLQELKDAAGRLVWGDPLEKTTDIGPVINSAKRDEHAALIARAQADGTRRVEFPHAMRIREPWVKTGAYAQPAIVGCDQPNHPLVQEETMSPLLVVQRAENFEHALALCNGVRHGLVAAFFGNSPELQQKFLAEGRAGVLKFNTSTAGADTSLPFGGWKASGIGPPEHGGGDRFFYTRAQTVYGAEKLRLG